jgi:hypothetical protein
MKSRRRWWMMVALLVVVAIGSLVGVRLWKVFRARHDVNELVVALEAYRIKFGQPLEGSTAEICAVLRGEDVGGQNPDREAVVESYKVNAAGEFVDPWSTAYRIQAGPDVRVYSCGPNQLDEGGDGDDIASWRR